MRPESLIDRLTKIVGAEHIFFDESARREVSKTTEVEMRTCSAVVYPGSTQEVQAVFEVASLSRTAVWPFSAGKNWGYGTRNALEDGAIVLMLSRLNRILEVNSELAFAVLEPGVTQLQLHEYLENHHPHLIADCTDSSPFGSVVGNSIERGYGYTPSGDHFAQLCGLEVVLPTGELIQTGGGDLGPSRTWNTHKWGYGPSIDGIFSQSNFGVIVKAGVWLRPKPEHLVLFTIDIAEEKLPAAIEGLRKLALSDVIKSHVHIANAFQTLSLVAKYPEAEKKAGRPISLATQKELQLDFGIPDWTAVGGLYGSKAIVMANIRTLKKTLSPLGEIRFFDESTVRQSTKLVRLWRESNGRGVRGLLARIVKSLITKKDFSLVALLPEMYGVLLGKPTWQVLKSAYFKTDLTPADRDLDPARDGCGVIWMAPAVPMSRSEIETAQKLASSLFDRHGFNLSACFTMMNQRTLFFLVGIFFDQNNTEEKIRAQRLYEDLHHEFSNKGFQHYRGGVSDWRARQKNTETVSATRQLLSDLKKVVDPNDILAPSRYR